METRPYAKISLRMNRAVTCRSLPCSKQETTPIPLLLLHVHSAFAGLVADFSQQPFWANPGRLTCSHHSTASLSQDTAWAHYLWRAPLHALRALMALPLASLRCGGDAPECLRRRPQSAGAGHGEDFQ